MERRKSNFELLRIISIFLIVIFHCAYKSGFSFEPGFSVNKLIVKSLWMLGEWGVNCFILITGYFMVNGRFRLKKLVLLIAEVQFYHWTTAFALSRLTGFEFSGKKDIFFEFFPLCRDLYWFATVYVLLYLLSPFINIFLRAMDKRTYQQFLALVLLLYCVIPTVFGLYFGSSEGMLYYNRLIWLGIVYCIGAYIRLYPCPRFFTMKRGGVMCISSLLVMVLSILVIDRFTLAFARLGTTEAAYLWTPNNVPMLLLSVGLFLVMMNLEIGYIPWINCLASTTLGIYLLHDGRLAYWLWGTLFHCRDAQGSPWLALRILLSAGAVVVVCMAVDLVRQWLERHTLRPLLDRLWPDARQGG